jgi:type IV pilus assembly protein PilB
MSREPSLQIRRKAVELGMETLRESGIKAVLSGATTVQEVVKCT